MTNSSISSSSSTSSSSSNTGSIIPSPIKIALFGLPNNFMEKLATYLTHIAKEPIHLEFFNEPSASGLDLKPTGLNGIDIALFNLPVKRAKPYCYGADFSLEKFGKLINNGKHFLSDNTLCLQVSAQADECFSSLQELINLNKITKRSATKICFNTDKYRSQIEEGLNQLNNNKFNPHEGFQTLFEKIFQLCQQRITTRSEKNMPAEPTLITFPQKTPEYARVMLLGAGKSGKTNLLRRMSGEQFAENLPSTKGSGFIPYHYEDVKMEMWDIAATIRRRRSRSGYVEPSKYVLSDVLSIPYGGIPFDTILDTYCGKPDIIIFCLNMTGSIALDYLEDVLPEIVNRDEPNKLSDRKDGFNTKSFNGAILLVPTKSDAATTEQAISFNHQLEQLLRSNSLLQKLIDEDRLQVHPPVSAYRDDNAKIEKLLKKITTWHQQRFFPRLHDLPPTPSAFTPAVSTFSPTVLIHSPVVTVEGLRPNHFFSPAVKKEMLLAGALLSAAMALYMLVPNLDVSHLVAFIVTALALTKGEFIKKQATEGYNRVSEFFSRAPRMEVAVIKEPRYLERVVVEGSVPHHNPPNEVIVVKRG